MTLTLHHNFSGYETVLTVDEFTKTGKFYNFKVPFPPDAPFGEYSYTMVADSQLVSSGLINYSQYQPVEYIVSDKTLYVVYQN